MTSPALVSTVARVGFLFLAFLLKNNQDKPMDKKKPKGGARPGSGRKAGTPNKATIEAREAIAAFVEGNVDRLNGWLDDIAKQSPMAAFDRFMSVVEYHIPKLQRSESQMLDKDGKPANHEVTVRFVGTSDSK